MGQRVWHNGSLLRCCAGVLALAMMVSPCISGTVLQQMRLANFEEAVVVAERSEPCASLPAACGPQSASAIDAAPSVAILEAALPAQPRDGNSVPRVDSLNNRAPRTDVLKCE